MGDISYPSFADQDQQIRLSAIARVRTLAQVYGDEIPWQAISQGMTINGEQVLIANRAVGIFKPRQMQRGALSIKTSSPRVGRVNIYADAEGADGTFVYSLQGTDPNNHYNRALRQCWEDQSPLIYFYAFAEGVYKAIFPCYIENIDSQDMTCRVSIAPDTTSSAQSNNLKDSEAWRIARRYVLRETRVRLHQAEFRSRVLNAYGRRCAMTGLPVSELLEAAHIIPDSHELGVPEVTNGICMSRIHHRAFDANLIGVTADYVIQVSDRLMGIEDGAVLEGGIKALHGESLSLPKNKKKLARPRAIGDEV